MTHPHIRKLRESLAARQATYDALKQTAEQIERERLDALAAAEQQRQQQKGPGQ